jgi:hypothetical protein
MATHIKPYDSKYREPLQTSQINLIQRDHEDKSPVIYKKTPFENETIMQQVESCFVPKSDREKKRPVTTVAKENVCEY